MQLQNTNTGSDTPMILVNLFKKYGPKHQCRKLLLIFNSFWTKTSQFPPKIVLIG